MAEIFKQLSLYSWQKFFDPPKVGISETTSRIRKILFLASIMTKCHMCIKNLRAGGSGGHGVNGANNAPQAFGKMVFLEYLWNRDRYRQGTFGAQDFGQTRIFWSKNGRDWAWHLRNNDVTSAILALFLGTFWRIGTLK